MKLNRILLFTFWIALILLSAGFYFENAVVYLFGYRNERFAGNELWFVTHILGATCLLFLGPLQFWKRFRAKYIRWHRLSGKVYIFGSLVAGIAGFRLSLIYDCVGCRYGSVALAILLILTTSMAWYAIKHKNIQAHRQFMIRSYAVGLTFVFVRLPQILPLKFIVAPLAEDILLRRTVQEGLYSFVPLFLVELFLIWIPSLKSPHLSAK